MGEKTAEGVPLQFTEIVNIIIGKWRSTVDSSKKRLNIFFNNPINNIGKSCSKTTMLGIRTYI